MHQSVEVDVQLAAMLDAPRSPAHEIVRTLWGALRSLGVQPTPSQVEFWGLAIHCALSSTARQFHSHEHVIELAKLAEPLEVIAALYHDVIYVQVDGALPSSVKPLLESLFERTGATAPNAGWRITASAEANPVTADVLRVFGRKVGDELGPITGLNELASAFVAALHVGEVLEREDELAIAACIEATIPFRADPGGPLFERLCAMGIAHERAAIMTKRAVRLANRDVGNFAAADPAIFLANTWKLLPETNPTLQVASRYTVSDYRVAIMKMTTFLEGLAPERVFHSWGNHPEAEELGQMIEAARANIAFAVRYLHVKLYALAVIEALCLATGGDLPMQYVMGDMTRRGERSRLESFLPQPQRMQAESLLRRLLALGGTSEQTFDISPSPLASYLLGALGEEKIRQGVTDAREWWTNKISPMDFLEAQRSDAIGALATAASELAETRRDALRSLAIQLARRSSRPPAMAPRDAAADPAIIDLDSTILRRAEEAMLTETFLD